MVGKNNVNIYNKHDSQATFGLRKLSVGVASVLLGSSWMMFNTVAHADTVEHAQEEQLNAVSNSVQPFSANSTKAVAGANSRSMTVLSPDSVVENVQTPESNSSASAISAPAASNVNNQATFAGSVEVNDSSNSSASEYRAVPAQNFSDNKVVTPASDGSVYSAQKSVNDGVKDAVVNLSIYDTSVNKVVGTTHLNAVSGANHDFKIDVSDYFKGKQIPSTAYSFSGQTNYSVKDGLNNFTIFIKHNKEVATRNIVVRQRVTNQNAFSGDDFPFMKSGAPFEISQNGFYDLFTKTYQWGTNSSNFQTKVSGHSKTTIDIPYGYYLTATYKDANLMVNGKVVGSTIGAYAPSIPQTVRVSNDGPYSDGVSSVDVVMETPQSIIRMLTELDVLADGKPENINVVINTPVEQHALNVMQSVNFVVDNPKTGKSIKLSPWYFSVSADNGFPSGFGQQIVSHVPKGFRFAATQDIAGRQKTAPDNLTSPDAINDYWLNTFKGLSPKLEENRGLADGASFATIHLVPDYDQAVNYRYFDDDDETNRSHVGTAEVLIRNGSVANGSINEASDPWKGISGVKKVSQDDLDALQLINNMGADGRANGATRAKDLDTLHSLGFDTGVNADLGNSTYWSQVYVFNGYEYSARDGVANLESAVVNNLVNSINEANQNFDDNTNYWLSQINSASFNEAKNTSSISAMSGQLDRFTRQAALKNAYVNQLSQYNFAENYDNEYAKPLVVYQGLGHLIDSFDRDHQANENTMLHSGQKAGDVVKGSTGIFDSNTYGDLQKYTINVQMVPNANEQTWPTSYDKGPVTGFAGKTSVGGYNFDLLTTDNKFGDSAYTPLSIGQQDIYTDTVQTGSGTSYSVDDVTGEVYVNNAFANYSSNPVYYFPQIKGYDLLINGQKVGDDYYALTPSTYLSLAKDGQINVTVEYAPQKVAVNIKFVDQHGNVLTTQQRSVNVDGSSLINAQDLASQYIQQFNNSAQKQYMEFVSSDIPDAQFITANDLGKTFNYTVNVKISDVKLIDDGMDKNVRTVYFVNRSDPNNSIPAITDIALIKVQKQVITDNNGDQVDTGGYVYSGLDTFDDVRSRITVALGTNNWTVTSGNQYLGSFKPAAPGGESITVEYN